MESNTTGLSIVLFETMTDATRREVEARLRNLLDRAARNAARDMAPRPLPSLVHHVTLAFSEEWDTRSLTGAVLFHRSERDVAFAHVGGNVIRAALDGREAELPWTQIPSSRGRTARGFSVYAGGPARIDLEWASAPGSAGIASFVSAVWMRAAESSEIDRVSTARVTRPARADRIASSDPTDLRSREKIRPGDLLKPVLSPGTPPAPVVSAEPISSLGRPSLKSASASAATERSVADTSSSFWTSPPAKGAALAPSAPAGSGSIAPATPAVAHDRESLAGQPPSISPPESPRPRIRPSWPAPHELERRPSVWKRMWPVAAVIAALFAAGWWISRPHGGSAASRNGSPSQLTQWLASLGWAGPRYELQVSSEPAGAWVSVDGKELARRTPATLQLKPGAHEVSLSLSELGSVAYTVRGARGEHLRLDAAMWGSLTVYAPDASTPVRVSLDGTDRGFAPVTVAQIAPGPHQLEFTGPGLTPWLQTAEIRVGETNEIIARPFESPATGMLRIQASSADDHNTAELKGASVWIDGKLRGQTPLTLELSRGPHSVRVVHRGESSQVQVIDLPGGNQRFAEFQFGDGIEHLDLDLLSESAPIRRDRPAIVSATLDGAPAGDTREMWLHVRTPEGPWRRYPMTLLEAPGGMVGVAVFPAALLDGSGRAPHYVSAVTRVGDEYFTEIQDLEEPSRAHHSARRTVRAAESAPATEAPGPLTPATEASEPVTP